MKVLVDNAPFKTLGQGGLLPLFKFLIAQAEAKVQTLVSICIQTSSF